MTEKSNQTVEKNQDQIISLVDPKILFFHYFFEERSAGVNRVIENNVKGMQLYYPNLKPIFLSGGFEKEIFYGHEKRLINLDQNDIPKEDRAKVITKNIERSTEDVNIISAHNILRGINPAVSGGFRDFAEKSNKIIEYRNHDFVLRYPDNYKKMLEEVNSFTDWFPKSPKIIQTTLTTSTRGDMEIFFRGDIELMRNSVIYEDLCFKDNGKDEKLKELLFEKGIFEEKTKHLIYAVRADERKNIEEALYLTSLLSYTTGKKHKLIVTASREKDFQNPEDNIYQKEIEKFANTFKIPCSIGEVYRYVNNKEFNIGNLYRAGDVAISTAFKEGFGYAFVEPWVAFANEASKGKYVLGRRIREVCEDFEQNGMKFQGILYDNSILYSKGNPEDRMKYFGEILGDKKNFKKFAKRVDLEKRIENSKKSIAHNAKIVKKVYGHEVVAKDLIKILKLPGYEKII